MTITLGRGSADPPPLVVPWVIKILGPYFNFADAMGPKADFTQQTEKSERKTIENPEFYLLDLEFHTIKF